MTSSIMNTQAAPPVWGSRWKDMAVGVAYLIVVGTVFIGVVTLAAILFTK